MKDHHQEIIRANTIAFADYVCQAISDMTGRTLETQKSSLSITPFSTEYDIIAFIPFSGTVQGEYIIAFDLKTAAMMNGVDCDHKTPDELHQNRYEYLDLLKEVMNLSVARSIEILDKRYGELTFMPTTVVHGKIEFPNYSSGNILIGNAGMGIIQCAFSLNLAKLRIGEKLSETMAELKAANENLEEKVRLRTKDLHKANENLRVARDALWGEMELAKKIQTALLPESLHVPGYDIAAYHDPADEVGGDYYDVISVQDHHYFMIGDVSGHGVSAGLVMMMAQTAIHTVLNMNPEVPVTSLLHYVNKTLVENIQKLGEDKYMTITAMYQSDTATFAFAGMHQDILIYRSDKDAVEAVETNGMWMGIMPEIESMLPINRVSLKPSDCMVLYTDGLTEARDENDDMLGISRLISSIKENGGKSAAQIKNAIVANLKGYKKDDDVTILVIKRTL